MKRSPPDARDQARRAALNALKRARRAAARTGATLSDWEGDFLGSVEDRIRTYGRAFADPEKGAPGQSLSLLQHVKLKEITVKAKGGKPLANKLEANKLQARKPLLARRGLRRGPAGGAER
ncbi:MAG TPA: hypothetical protein VHZ26_00025 [Caulobacteraceae bacterium]|jgi:hypothetical protein|nr:hypothetical protein [Caulobacteraceae bacterium]